MAISAREVYLLLRAKDEASRVVRGFSSNLLRSAAQVQAQALRAEAMNKRTEAARLRSVGATNQQIQSQLSEAKALENEARQVERNAGVWRHYIMQLEAVGAALIGTGTGFALAGGMALKFFVDSALFFEQYQKQVTLTKTQIREFKVSLAELSKIGLSVADHIAVPFEEIQPALYDIFSSMDVNTKQAQILLEAFSKAAVGGQTSIRNAARGTISILNAFNIPAEQVNRILDIQFELVRRGVGTYEEFATHLGNVIPSAARAGQSVETMAAALVFLTRNGLSAAMASTSAARAFEAMSHPKTVEHLAKLGIKIRDAKGNFLPLNESLRKLRDYLNTLPPADRVAALVDIFKGAGGTIQARRFLEQVLLRKGELEEFEGYLKDIQKTSGAFEGAYGQMSDTVASKSQLISNKWQILKVAIGEAVIPYLLKLMNAVGKVIDWFNKLDPKTKNLIIVFGLLAAAGAVVLGVILAIVGVFLLIAGAIAAAGVEVLAFLGIFALLGIGVAGLIATFVLLYQKSEPFRNILKDIAKRAKDVWMEFVKFGQNIKKSFDENLKPPLMEVWKVINEKLLPAMKQMMDDIANKVQPKISEAFRVIEKVAKPILKAMGDVVHDELVPALKDLAKWWGENKKNIMPFVEAAAQVVKWILIIAAVIAGSAIAVGFMAFVQLIVLVIGTIKLLGKVIGFVKELIIGLTSGWKSSVKSIQGYVKTVMDMFGNAYASLLSTRDKVVGFFAKAGEWLLNAGESVVQGLIDGIKNKMKDLASIASKVAQTIKDHLPFSPAKTGPLSGSGNPYNSGKAIAQLIAAGMYSNMPVVSDASNAIANTVRGAFNPQTPGHPITAYPGGVVPGSNQEQPSKNVNTTVNVYTTEVDPVKHSAELGFLITNRMS